MKRSTYLGVSAAVGLCLLASSTLAASFTPLPDLDGGPAFGIAYDVSEDGRTAVGLGWGTLGPRAVKWEVSPGGVVGPTTLEDGIGGSTRAEAISADGSVIAGQGRVMNPDGTFGRLAFTWTPDGVGTSIGDLPGGLVSATATAVSSHGSVVVGQSTSGAGTEGFVWTSESGMVALGDLPGGIYASGVRDVSADGSLIVGQSWSDVGEEAVLWTSPSNIVGLGDLPGGAFSSQARAISDGGSVIAGFGNSADGIEAFRWTASEGMIGLGELPGGGFRSQATAISADGSTIGGFSETDEGLEAFLWTEASGMQSLEVLLESLGLDLSGWRLENVLGITSNGSVIVGSGGSPTGELQAFIAVIPEPGTAILILGGLVFLSTHGRTARRLE